MAVPFHVSTIKNISHSIDDLTELRLNFFHPGATTGEDKKVFPKPDAQFLTEITYRSSNNKEPGDINAPSQNLNNAFQLTTELMERYKTREAEAREKKDIAKKDKLIIVPNKTIPRLRDLYIRPKIDGKRLLGTLGAHSNGLRYTSIRDDKIDILYSNIKHAFYQPRDRGKIMRLHFRLKNRLLIGKVEHDDIQGPVFQI